MSRENRRCRSRLGVGSLFLIVQCAGCKVLSDDANQAVKEAAVAVKAAIEQLEALAPYVGWAFVCLAAVILLNLVLRFASMLQLRRIKLLLREGLHAYRAGQDRPPIN